MARRSSRRTRPVTGTPRARRRAGAPDRGVEQPAGTGSPEAGETCVLGLLLEGHLGDTLCTTPLARQLVQERRLTVKVTEHPSTRAVFAHNPCVSGFSMLRGFSLLAWRQGDGHVIQQLQRGLGVEVSDPPRPELFLASEERAWAATWLAEHVPAGKKVCVLSPGAQKTARFYQGVDWDRVSRVLQEEYAVVQPLLSAADPPPEPHRQPRRHAGQTPGAIIAVDLPTRHYLALVAAADLLVGGYSGGPHVAAAFHVPTIVIVWPELASKLTFPVHGWGTEGEHFAYPTQAHLVTSSLTQRGFDAQALRAAIPEALALEPGSRPRPAAPRGSGRRRSA
jgi:hypothetical protein